MADERQFERIRRRAFNIYQLRSSRRAGDALSDWLDAERQIKLEERLQKGPAISFDFDKCGPVTDADGRDIENPT
jgi:hypothetical protein